MEAKARVLDQFERVYLSRALAQAGGNVSDAARRSGKERRAFGKLLKKHSIDKRMFAASSSGQTRVRRVRPSPVS